jgi:hypothetical protein
VLSENYLIALLLKGKPKRITDGSVIVHNEHAGSGGKEGRGIDHR